MEIAKPKKCIFKKSAAGLILGLILLVSLFGLFAGVSMDGAGMMMSCAFMAGQTAMCGMDIFDHIAVWKNATSGVMPISLALIVFLAVFILFIGFLSQSVRRLRRLKSRWQYLRRQNLDAVYFNSLLLIFAKGLMHPKIY